jgi:hypothetical protein
MQGVDACTHMRQVYMHMDDLWCPCQYGRVTPCSECDHPFAHGYIHRCIDAYIQTHKHSIHMQKHTNTHTHTHITRVTPCSECDPLFDHGYIHNHSTVARTSIRPTFLHTCILNTYMHIYKTYVLAYMHTHIDLHTCIHAYSTHTRTHITEESQWPKVQL